MNIKDILLNAIEQSASDVFIVVGTPVSFKLHGQIEKQGQVAMKPSDTEQMIREIYTLAHRELGIFVERGDDDFSFAVNGMGRFRVNAYKQRSSWAAVIRVVKFELPHANELGIPEIIMDLAKKTKGLVLVTGPAGSGKSTTLSCIIDQINQTKNGHIITLEDPIEFIHKHQQSIVSQREIDIDTQSYVSGLKAVLREAPNVILLGEMRDYETMQIAMTAAETGQLLFSTLHTLGAANTIDRIIDVFPANQHQQIRIQLSMVLQAVVSQQLIPGVDGGLVPVFEVMFVNSAIRNLIRESKTHQIDAIIAASGDEGMQTMDMSILKYYKEGKITKESALLHATNYDMMLKKIKI